MTENLIFVAVILGMFAITAIIFITMGVYRQKKVEKAYRKYQDLAKAKREYAELDTQFEKVNSKYRSIKTRIDIMVENERYLTKVKVFNQQKELEKLRYELEKLDTEKTELYHKCVAQYQVWKDLRIKYRIDY